MSGAGYLLLRRDGGLFGVASAVVRGLSRRGPAYRVEMLGALERGLFADEVVGVIEKLDVRPLGRLARRYWPEPAEGWAIHGGDPVVVIDPLRPPGALLEKLAEPPAEGAGLRWISRTGDWLRGAPEGARPQDPTEPGPVEGEVSDGE